MLRWFWLIFGIVWGVCLGDAARYANANYEAIKATADGIDARAPYGPLILLFTVGSVLLLVLLLIVGVVALRRRRGFWSLMLGVLAGMGGSSVMAVISSA